MCDHLSHKKERKRKEMKRTLLVAVVMVLALSMAISGTVAYLSDTDSDVNVMTLGNVDIVQLENGEDGPIDIDPLYPAYIDAAGKVHGEIDKEVTVKNVGKSDAFVRTVVAFEAGKITDKAAFDKLIKPAFKDETAVEWVNSPVEIDGEKYFIATVVYDEILAAGETTEPSLLSVYMDPKAKNDDVAQFGEEYKILVVSQAVQTVNLEDLGAAEALEAAFGAVTATTHPWAGEDAADTEGEKPDLIITNVAQLRDFAERVNNGETFEGKLVALAADLDLNGADWTPIGNSSSNKFKGTFDGNDHYISNFKVTHQVASGLFGYVHGTVRNLNVKNATVNSNHYAGGIAAHGLCSKFEGCSVEDSEIISTIEKVADNKYDNGDKVGGIVGYLSAEPTAYVRNCTVTNTLIRGYRHLGGIVGYANKTSEVSNCTAAYNTIDQVIGDGNENYKNLEVGKLIGAIVGEAHADATIQNNKALAKAGNADQLIAALEMGCDVELEQNIKIDPAGMSNAYGTTGINVTKGQTIDGNDKILDIKGAGGTWDSGINTTGGLIKDLTVTGSFRGIFINHNSDHSEPVVLEDVIIDGTTYTVSCDQGLNQNLIATNSTFKGWTSFAATLGEAKFVDCYFGEGNGYSYCRPYAPTEFVGCAFEAGYTVEPAAAVTFEDCTIGGEPLTTANLDELVTNTANVTVK